MFKQLIGATAALFIGVGSLSAQHGGGGGGHGGGGFGGGGRGGYGGYGGYGRGGYGYGGFYGGIGLYGYGFGYPYGYGGGYYDLGGMGYSSFGGYGSGGGGIYPASPIIPYSSGYTPAPSTNLDMTLLPALPTPLTPPIPSTTSVAASASLTVIVPEGGQVWFDNTLTPQKGSKWVYNSPTLEPGKTYTVNIKARWAEGGQDKAYDIPLRIVAGDKMTMDLTKIR